MAAPQTGFEATGDWTTLAREQEFLEQLAGETAMTLAEAGRTVQDRPIWRCDLGAGSSTMVIVCLQHGNEPASREGALALLRDLAYSEEPEVAAYLANHRLVVVPNVNADKLGADRLNANGVNLNRDWVQLTQPETRAIRSAIRDAAPAVVVDAHEYFATGQDWWPSPVGMPGTIPAITSLAQAAVDDGTAFLLGAGYTAGLYPVSGTPWAGLSTTAGGTHAIGLLSETNAYDPDKGLRVTVQNAIFHMLLDWHTKHREAIDTAHADSLAYARRTWDPTPYPTREYIGTATAETAEVSGYQLDTPLPIHLIAAHGIEVEEDGFVPINQAARLMVAALCDPSSTQRVVTAARVHRTTPGPPPGRWTQTWVMTDQGRRRVTAIYHQDGPTRRRLITP